MKTVAEFIAYAKANPGKLSYAVDVTAGAAPFAARLLNKRADLDMVEVPYRSAAQMAQDVASGTIPVLISSMAAANAMVQAGKIRRLALSSSASASASARPADYRRNRAGRHHGRLVRRGGAGRHAAPTR